MVTLLDTFRRAAVAVLTAITFAIGCSSTSGPPEVALEDSRSGGAQTVFVQGVKSFSTVMPIITSEHAALHDAGDIAFGNQFVPAPAQLSRGLGPIFNANSCIACHVNDGRGRPPLPGETMVAMLFRLSVPGTDENGGPLGAPGFGGQLQQRAIYGVRPEATVSIRYAIESHAFADGSLYELAVPSYSLIDPYQALPAGLMLSPRVPPAVFGLGLLEAISDDMILSHADPTDANHDGICGRANMVWDETAKQMRIGRFGWKAEQPNLKQQSAGALKEDMGVTNVIFSVESCHGQEQYRAAVDSGMGAEVNDSTLTVLAAYMQTLGVPARRNANDPTVRRGKYLFEQAQCSACHIPSMVTGSNAEFPELSNQKIFPYTDLLLHDMGSALSDNRPSYSAGGNDWRTPPLWGIGLTMIVNGHTRFLHDGRARSILEAIMWHGGEAEGAKKYVWSLSSDDRGALVKFVESL